MVEKVPVPGLELEVFHHGVQLPLLLVQLEFQLRHNLHLYPCLRRGLVPKAVRPVQVSLEGVEIWAGHVAARPLAVAVAEQQLGRGAVVVLGVCAWVSAATAYYAGKKNERKKKEKKKC